MLLRSAPLPQRAGYAYEPKWDGFRALVSTVDGRLVVRSRRRWDMTDLVPELADFPPGLVSDGELIAFGTDGLPSFPRLCRRMLAGQRDIPVMFVVFDLLAEDGESLVSLPYRARRQRLDALQLAGPHWCTTITTSDGDGLWRWVCDQGLEGVVAKRLADRYWPGERRWLKVKNRDYWRYPSEVEAVARRVAHGYQVGQTGHAVRPGAVRTLLTMEKGVQHPHSLAGRLWQPPLTTRGDGDGA
jgi:bifunctional non-homologous end joining protein LigD